jgi:hypothetical protein
MGEAIQSKKVLSPEDVPSVERETRWERILRQFPHAVRQICAFVISLIVLLFCMYIIVTSDGAEGSLRTEAWILIAAIGAGAAGALFGSRSE